MNIKTKKTVLHSYHLQVRNQRQGQRGKYLRLLLLSEKDECGYPEQSFSGNVIGGEDTQPGQFPYTALLGYHSDGKVRCEMESSA